LRAQAGSSFYLRDIVFVSTPDGPERDVAQWAISTSRIMAFR